MHIAIILSALFAAFFGSAIPMLMALIIVKKAIDIMLRNKEHNDFTDLFDRASAAILKEGQRNSR